MNKISACLWFDTQAEDAAKLYTGLFADSKITRIVRYPQDVMGKKKGDVMTVEFELFGGTYVGLNGGGDFKFNEAVSFVVHCDTQEEIDRYWDALVADGGKPVQCGWLSDRFGLSWQIVPRILDEYLADGDEAKVARVFGAMMQMVKLDIATFERAYRGE